MGMELETTDVNFQVLRRTCGTRTGPSRSGITKKSIPSSVRAAAEALETELINPKKHRTN
jgi:hypothetical protein